MRFTEQVESEVKLLLKRDELARQKATILEEVRFALEDGWSLWRASVRCVQDVYLDSQDGVFINVGAQFRLRRRAVKSGWVSCFKMPCDSDHNHVLSRTKVRSKVTIEEALALTQGMPCGRASELAWQHLSNCDKVHTLLPTILVEQCRYRYTIRPEGYPMDPQRDYQTLHFLFDDCLAFRLEKGDITSVLTSVEISADGQDRRKVSFVVFEMEVEPSRAGDPVAVETFNEMSVRLSSLPIQVLDVDKYTLAHRLLEDDHGRP